MLNDLKLTAPAGERGCTFVSKDCKYETIDSLSNFNVFERADNYTLMIRLLRESDLCGLLCPYKKSTFPELQSAKLRIAVRFIPANRIFEPEPPKSDCQQRSELNASCDFS